jgi:WD40 repeat protein
MRRRYCYYTRVILLYALMACVIHNGFAFAGQLETEAMVPAGAEIVLNVDHSNVSGARFVQLPNDKEIIISDGDAIRYWNMGIGKLTSNVPHSNDPVLDGGVDRSAYYNEILTLSQNGEKVVSGGYSGFVERTLSSGSYLFDSGSMLEGISNIEYSRDTKYILMSGYGSVSLWNSNKRQRIRTIEDGVKLYYSTFDNSGDVIITTSLNDFTIRLWDTKTGRLLRIYSIPGRAATVEDESGLDLLRFSHDGKHIFATEAQQGRIHLWNVDGKDEINNIDVGKLSTYIVSQDDAALIIGRDNGDVCVWDLNEMKLVKTIHTGRGPIISLSQSERGADLLVNGKNYFQLVSLTSGKIIATFFVLDDHGVAYTPRGRFVTDADPHKAFKIIRDNEELPIEDFIRLNRRPTVNDATNNSH